MKQDKLDRLLAELSQLTPPDAPDLRREVRAEIAGRRYPGPLNRLFNSIGWTDFLRPGTAVTALALSFVIGTIPSMVTPADRDAPTDAANARTSLHLEVFAPDGLLALGTPGPALDSSDR